MLKIKLSQTIPNPLQLSLECSSGELHALVGPSGSGKTTALRTIAGLSNAQTGSIECDGEIWFDANESNGITTSLCPAERSCGFLFQQYALFPHLSALENVCIPLYNSVAESGERQAQARQWLNRMGIGELANRMPNQLSGGQQQRVALARALARSPKILLLDEPFSAVDAPTRQGLYKTLAELRKDLNIPILLVTHDEGSCHVPAVLRNATILTHWGRKDEGHRSGSAYPADVYSEEVVHPVYQPEGHLKKLGSYACYDPNKVR